jgi:hypothetical protein
VLSGGARSADGGPSCSSGAIVAGGSASVASTTAQLWILVPLTAYASPHFAYGGQDQAFPSLQRTPLAHSAGSSYEPRVNNRPVVRALTVQILAGAGALQRRSHRSRRCSMTDEP